MANTVSISALRKTLWRAELYDDVSKELYFEQYINRSDVKSIGMRSETSPNGIVQEITDLSADRSGATVTYGLSVKLTSDPASSGVDGDNEMEGNETPITTYDQSLSINQKRNAVRLTGKMDEKKVAYNMRTDAKEKLKIWLAEVIQKDMFDKLCGKTTSTFANTPTAPSSYRACWAGGQTADTGLTSSHKMDTKVINKAKQLACVTTSGVPLIRPINYKGKKFYVMIMHPYQASDLKDDPVYNQAMRDAWWRGEDNPIFTNSIGVYNGVVLHEHEDIYQWAGGSGSAYIARAVLCGAQALVLAYGSGVDWVEEPKDYRNKWAICCGRMWGCQKTRFNSIDYGVVTCATAAAAYSTS